MKRHKIYNKRAEELMKRLFEKQGIKSADLSVKEAAEIDDMTKDAHKEEECDEGIDVKMTQEEALPAEVKTSEEMSEEIRVALGSVLGEEAAERVMEKIEGDITEVATALAEERDAKMEEIKKSKIAATQEEINNLKAKLEAIKNDEGEIVEETEDTSEDK
tara:strand:- start:955 stop:1437 length:483 start_codon:yes stop_codon:yes gene_type:complete